MDPFDDILLGAPATRVRGKFKPKAQSKRLPPKEISSSENATSSKDGKNMHVASSSTFKGISRHECHNTVASTLSTSVEESMRSNPQQVTVIRYTSALVDDLPFMVAASEVDANRNFTNFPKSAFEVNPVGFEVGSVTDFIPEINLNKGTKEPVHHANAVESALNNVASPSTTCSTVGGMEEPPKSGEGSFFYSNKSLELIDNSVRAKTSRQLRKKAARKPAKTSLNEDDYDLDLPYNSNRDEPKENDDEYEVDYSSKKRRESAGSKKKSKAKKGKTSQKRKKINDDLEKTTKRRPKKLSHSTRRRKRRGFEVDTKYIPCIDPSLYTLVFEQLQASIKAEQDPSRDASDIMTREEEEVAASPEQFDYDYFESYRSPPW